MEIVVNGEERRVESDVTVADLVGMLGLSRRRVAVERNAEVVPRSLWGSEMLRPGDRVEVVRFVGGG